MRSNMNKLELKNQIAALTNMERRTFCPFIVYIGVNPNLHRDLPVPRQFIR